jgi:N-acyl amino acid synthase of PEP-CTERM/exosortase system
MTGVSSWQDLLSCYREHFEVVRAETPTLVDEAYRLRHQVYCIENSYEDRNQHKDGRERDSYDDTSVHALLVHKRTGAVAGTVRVILPGADAQGPPLPIHIVVDPHHGELLRRLPHSHVAEISRLAISKEFRCRCTEAEDRRMLRYITFGLIRGALEICREHDIHYICAVMERALIRLLGRLGLVFEHVGGVIEYHGARQPCVAGIGHLVERSKAERTLLWRYTSQIAKG